MNDVIYDVKGLLRDLEGLQPGLKKQLVRDAKLPAQPIIKIIKSQIPTVAPLSGMSKTPVKRTPSQTHPNGGTNSSPNGRLAWGNGKAVKSVTAKFRSGRSTSRAVTPLVSIWVNSPAVAMADVAGKGSMRKARTLTSEYEWKGQTRKHRVTTQGRTMIRRLKERNLNNFVYPNVEDALDNAQTEVKLIIEKYAAKVNRKLN